MRCSAAIQPSAADVSSMAAPRCRRMKILIVDDEPALSDHLARRSATPATPSTVAADGERADFLVRTESYDAVLLDLGLPRIDGLTLLRGWRESGLTVPVLVLTARGSWHEKVRASTAAPTTTWRSRSDGRSARPPARPDPPRERTARAGAAVRRRDARSAAGARDAGRRAGPADRPRVSRAVVSDAPPRPRRLAGRADGAHLRAGLRPRLQHRRGLRRAPAPQARALADRNRPRSRLQARLRDARRCARASCSAPSSGPSDLSCSSFGVIAMCSDASPTCRSSDATASSMSSGSSHAVFIV